MRLPDLLGAVDGWAGAPWERVLRVELAANEVTVFIDLSGFRGGEEAVVRQTISTRIQRRGVEMRFVVAGGQNQRVSHPDLALVKAVARAHRWFGDLAIGRVQSVQEIARSEGVTPAYVRHVLPFAFLAPDIVAAILAGTQPVGVTAEALIKRTDLPLSWEEQRALLKVSPAETVGGIVNPGLVGGGRSLGRTRLCCRNPRSAGKVQGICPKPASA